MSRVLPVGSRVPSPTLLDSEGRMITLGALLASGRTVLYFYPRAHTPHCTRQACNLRDHAKELAPWGVRIVGVSGDSPERLASFLRRYALPFLLLSDRGGAAARAFGLPVFLGLVKRASFLIEDGVLVWRDLHPRVGEQAQDLLRMLEARRRFPAPPTEASHREGERGNPDPSAGQWPTAG
ncbi:MAG: peroxiredoxin [Methylacidiphilaceae bacterium]|nr:peroxiredoxin [Candidatus Methylacidiphilaceae bacterium]